MAAGRKSVVCVSAHTGEGMDELLLTIEEYLKGSMEFLHLLIPYSKAIPRTCCMFKRRAHVAHVLSTQLLPRRIDVYVKVHAANK